MNINRILIEIDRKVTHIMSQLDDLKAAVAAELSDVNLILTKLAAMPTVQNDPVVAQAITDLQASHTAMEAVLNPPAPAPVPAPTPVV